MSAATKNPETNIVERVIGLDSHPDTFTAAAVRGPTPAAAIVEKTFNKVPLGQLQSWAKKHTTAQDLIVLEASGNSFQVVRSLKAIERQAKVLESCQLGKLKEAHANNDKISAVRIGKAYLAGTAKEVWVPDPLTQERRDWFHAHRKAVKRATQVRNRLKSFLSDNGVRLATGMRLAKDSAQVQEQLRRNRQWSPRQWQVIELLLLELHHADEQRQHWRSLITQEVLSDSLLLSMVRLCGVREMVAFAMGAFIGDIKRFSSPAKLVKYVGLNPAFDDSGEGKFGDATTCDASRTPRDSVNTARPRRSASLSRSKLSFFVRPRRAMPYHSSPIVPGRSVKARAHTARLSRVARAYVRSGSEWKGAFHKEVDIVDPVTMKPDDKTKKPTAPP